MKANEFLQVLYDGIDLIGPLGIATVIHVHFLGETFPRLYPVIISPAGFLDAKCNPLNLDNFASAVTDRLQMDADFRPLTKVKKVFHGFSIRRARKVMPMWFADSPNRDEFFFSPDPDAPKNVQKFVLRR